MELPVSTSPPSLPRASLCPSSLKCFLNGYLFRRGMFRRRLLKCTVKPLLIKLSSEKDFLSVSKNQNCLNQEVSGNLWEDSEFVEVIGIGSRKDAVLDFCLDSPFRVSSLRFWNILMEDSTKVQLQQRFIRKDITPRIVEAPLALQSCSKAVILVASVAYGSDHNTAIDILKTVKSANGLSVGIILKPFSFEGRRRQDEVKELADKLQEHTNLCIVIDTDALLKKDMVTLDEALKTANNAVLMAINAVSILISEMHRKFLDVPDNIMKELKIPEVIEILKSQKEAKIGFGAGYNSKTSIMRAIYDCPFLSVAVKDLNGVVICILASSGVIDSSDVQAFLQTFRQTTECMGEIVVSIVHQPNLEPNLIVTTVITISHTGQQAPQKSGIFSKLAQHFPFIFNILRGNSLQYHDTRENFSPGNPCLSEVINSPDSGEMPNKTPGDASTEVFGIYSTEIQTLLSNNGAELYSWSDSGGSSEQSEVDVSEATTDFSNFYNFDTEGAPAFQRETLMRRNLGPGYQVALEWSKERANDSVAAPVFDSISIYKLPVGVKPSEELEDSSIISKTIHHSEKITEDDMKAQSELTSTLLKENYGNVSKKQQGLSARAASMLEAERDSQKKWSPIAEIKYRGGIYRGRCQGGLPEGKGCLSLGDGSIYDGMWRYGKKSGLGTFYFSNGDVFQGSWRDDVMHGKGWFYFHGGDRWFANFWKGKANGEGRFYSKLGDVFFGHFKDGWRHGHFLCINVDGESKHQTAVQFGDTSIFFVRQGFNMELQGDKLVLGLPNNC
ncbi:hypothetical protein F0562_034471 [Nyssa sinensis]|uniref:Protein ACCUMULATION AND REPLICATION OF CHLOROPLASTS 3 n=1 Tax=Nyssa sinensis TaxID=561372 RepID=A0A5J5AFV4_9ASTE|nr:hypothetical protein F0562_034471 [Nyssa sinensis]